MILLKRAFITLTFAVAALSHYTLSALLCSWMDCKTAFAENKNLLVGAGATFPYPLYSKWFAEFEKIQPDLEVSYQSIGSGGGIRQLLQKTIDFGASDDAMKEEELKKSTLHILHIPTIFGAVVVSYHLTGMKFVGKQHRIPLVLPALALNADVISKIYLGKILFWNHPDLQALNPLWVLPEVPIMAVYRSDGSGTTATFTEYLNAASKDWKFQVGKGKSVKWPVGIGGKGNEGVTGLIKHHVGALGYVESLYARKNQLPYFSLINLSGKVVAPNDHSVSQSGVMSDYPEDLRFTIVNSVLEDAYPLSALTYILAYQKMSGPKCHAFKKMMHWALQEGQTIATQQTYVALPKKLKDLSLKQVEKIECVEKLALEGGL